MQDRWSIFRLRIGKIVKQRYAIYDKMSIVIAYLDKFPNTRTKRRLINIYIP